MPIKAPKSNLKQDKRSSSKGTAVEFLDKRSAVGIHQLLQYRANRKDHSVIQREPVKKSELSEVMLLGDFASNFKTLKKKVLDQGDGDFLEFVKSLSSDEKSKLDSLFGSAFSSRAKTLKSQQQEFLAQQEKIKKEKLALEARAKDKEALKKGFNINDDKSKHKKGNDVDQGTFDKIAALYSDIREGKTKIKIMYGMDSVSIKEQLSFQQDVLKDIAKIIQTQAGRKLINYLVSGKHNINIGSSGQKTSAHQSPHPDPKGVLDFGPPTYANTSNKVGTGSDVKYVPNDHSGSLIIDKQYTSTDTVLFHELTHALHADYGVTQQGHLTESDPGLSKGHKDIGVKKEEYATVGLGAYSGLGITENAYRKEQGDIMGGAMGKLLYGHRKTYNGDLT